jgi:AcrR family transcriptional regulator
MMTRKVLHPETPSVPLKEAPDDARFDRTRKRLTLAVLELASEHDITAASVAELSRRAGINRSTFYSHAKTPVELLARVLSEDLDNVREHTAEQLANDGLLLRDVTRTTLREIIDHVVRYESVYGSANRASSMYALRVVLAEHVEHSVLTVFRDGYVIPPLQGQEPATLQAAFIAHGVAGAVEAWLRLPAPRNQDMLLASVEAVYPSWYAPNLSRGGRHVTTAIPSTGEAS